MGLMIAPKTTTLVEKTILLLHHTPYEAQRNYEICASQVAATWQKILKGVVSVVLGLRSTTKFLPWIGVNDGSENYTIILSSVIRGPMKVLMDFPA